MNEQHISNERISGGFPVYVTDPNGEDVEFWPEQHNTEDPFAIDVTIVEEIESDGASMANREPPADDRLSALTADDIKPPEPPVEFVQAPLASAAKDRVRDNFIVRLAQLRLARSVEVNPVHLHRLRDVPSTAHITDVHHTVHTQLGYDLVSATVLAYFWSKTIAQPLIEA